MSIHDRIAARSKFTETDRDLRAFATRLKEIQERLDRGGRLTADDVERIKGCALVTQTRRREPDDDQNIADINLLSDCSRQLFQIIKQEAPKFGYDPERLWEKAIDAESMYWSQFKDEVTRPQKPATRRKGSAPTGMLAPSEIAVAMSVPGKVDAIRMKLKRLLDDSRLPDKAWMEVNNPARGQAKILYDLSKVRPFLRDYEEPSAE